MPKLRIQKWTAVDDPATGIAQDAGDQFIAEHKGCQAVLLAPAMAETPATWFAEWKTAFKEAELEALW